jgi:hypothetical protein
VVFGVTLQIFQANYFSFISQLASAAQVTVQNILVQSITNGSVSVNTLVNANYAPTSNQASTVNQNINNLFSSNSVAGMSVTSYSINTNGGSIPSGGLPTSTIIILAVCIPVGTLCSFIIT